MKKLIMLEILYWINFVICFSSLICAIVLMLVDYSKYRNILNLLSVISLLGICAHMFIDHKINEQQEKVNIRLEALKAFEEYKENKDEIHKN